MSNTEWNILQTFPKAAHAEKHVRFAVMHDMNMDRLHSSLPFRYISSRTGSGKTSLDGRVDGGEYCPARLPIHL